MDAGQVETLMSSSALALLDELGPLDSTDAATNAVARLRKAGHPAEVVSLVVTQARLRHRALAKFGEAALRMLFTEHGLQQATRGDVAALHASRYRGAGLAAVADLGCGIGADSLAFATAGLAVMAVDRDEATARIAAFNLRDFPSSSALAGSAEDADLSGADGVWLDPARRDGARRLADPSDWSPSLDFAFGLSRPAGVKLGPGIDRDLIPEGWEAQWVSTDGETVELAVWSRELAREGVTRAALILRGGAVHELTAPHDAPDVEPGPLGEYLLEPDGAVIRARLIGDLARSIDARTIDPTIAYLTTDAPVSTPFAATFRVREVLPLDAKAIKRAVHEREIGVLEIKKRGVDIDPAEFRRRLAPKGTGSAALILTRISGARRAILAERTPSAR